MTNLMIAVSIALVQAVTAAAQPPAAAPTESAAASAKPDAETGTKVSRDTLLCRQEKVLGSLIPRKICYTRSEQEDREQQDHRTMDRLQSQFGTCPTPGCH